MRRSLAFEGLGFEVGGARGAALHRIGCRVPDGGATRAVQQLAATSSCHMAREMMPAAGCILVMALSLFDVFLGLRKVQRGWHELPKVTYAPKCSSVFKALSTKRLVLAPSITQAEHTFGNATFKLYDSPEAALRAGCRTSRGRARAASFITAYLLLS